MSDSTKPTLPTFSWIGHLKEDDRELLSSYGQFFPGHPGNVIIEKGVLQTEVFVVISGELEVLNDDVPEGEEPILLARVGPGETLGEMSLFNPAPAAATVRASEFSQLWRIADSDLLSFMDQNPGAGNALLRTLATILAQRLRQVDPEAFGLSAYAVINSPELEEREAALSGELPDISAEAPAPSVEEEEEPVTIAPVPSAALLTGKPAAPAAVVPQKLEEILPGSGTFKKRLTGTERLPDPDEVEPL